MLFLAGNTIICNYAGDTTSYRYDSALRKLMLRLEHDSVLTIEKFEFNYMKLNQDKCRLLISGHKYERVWVNIGSCKIWESNQQKTSCNQHWSQFKIWSLCF